MTTMSHGWIRLAVLVPAAAGELAAGLLAGVSGNGVQVEEAGNRHRIITYLAAGQEATAKRRRIAEALAPLDGVEMEAEEFVADQDWNRLWKRHFTATRLGRRLVVVPSWETYTPEEDDLVLQLDPGMAFGTGHHATTGLVLGWLEDLLEMRPATTVLDVGTGTGILAMAAARLGAAQVLAIDNDPEAVKAATQNVRGNDLAGRVTVSGMGLAEVTTTFDLVVANIVHDTLVALAPLLAPRVKDGGCLVLSGILRGEQEESIAGCYRGLGLTPVESRHRDEWAALLFRRG